MGAHLRESLKFTSPFKSLDLKGLFDSKYSCENNLVSV